MLAACGFKPMASVPAATSETDKAVLMEMAAVGVEVSTAHNQRLIGQEFRIALEDLLNPGELVAAQQRYRLRISLNPVTSPGFIAPDGKAQRFLIALRSSFELIDLQTATVIQRGDLFRNSSYSNLPNSYFSTYVAEQDTLKRMAEQLAEEYRMKLASVLTNPPTVPDEASPMPPEPIVGKPESAVTFPGIAQ